MKKVSIILLSVFLVSLLSSFKVVDNPIQKINKWTVLGKRTVSKKADHDVIMVTAKRGTFNKLKLKVMNSPIHLTNIKIVYANGTSENHILNRKFKRGEHSRVLDLKGKNRVIRKIVFNYKTKVWAKGKAQVIVLGKH